MPSNIAINDNLIEVVKGLSPNERVRVIGVIRPRPSSETLSTTTLATSRRQFREALLNADNLSKTANTSALEKLKTLGLKPQGGRTTGVFTVEIGPNDLKPLLAVADLESLALDSKIKLNRPTRG